VGTAYILETTDGGANWVSQVIPITSLNSFNFVNTQIGWAVASSNGSKNILKTTDGGENWIPCAMTPSGYNFSVQFINEMTGWISGFDHLSRTSVIIKTLDGGYTWIEQKSPCKNEGELSNIFFLDENTGWVIGGGILKTANGGGVVSVKDPYSSNSSMPQQMQLFQNYPNPFNPSTTIEFVVEKFSYTSLRIYDILGREVATLVDGIKEPGRYSVAFEGSKLSSGIYFVRMAVQPRDAKPIVQVKKMLLMK